MTINHPPAYVDDFDEFLPPAQPQPTPEQNGNDQWYSPRETAQLLGITLNYAYQLARRYHKFENVKLTSTGAVVFPKSGVDAYLESRLRPPHTSTSEQLHRLNAWYRQVNQRYEEELARLLRRIDKEARR